MLPVDEGEVMKRYSRFCWGMYYLRHRFAGLSVTSWGRSPAHNASLPGSVPDSEHQEWVACDLTWDPNTRPSDGVLRAACRECGLELTKEADHDHVQLATTPV
jgi:hypothetical protein